MVKSLLILCLSVPIAEAQIRPSPYPENVEIVRDTNGVPHVFAVTNKGACHGAGYIAACDRLFQMEFFRRSMRGRLAEILPLTDYPGALASDERARSLGFAHYADDLMNDASFDNQTKGCLQAYAAGVNVRLNELRQLPAGSWPPMFVVLNVASMDDWTAADCLLVWMYAQDLFGAFSDSDLSFTPPSPYYQLDVDGAVLPDLGNGLLANLSGGQKHPYEGHLREPSWKLKASHNMVIHGSRTVSGKPIMLAKPQHQVMVPSFYYEYAMRASSGDLDCRGAGLAGCPALLHGWNRFAAWSLTSMPADIADVYKVTFLDSSHATYDVDGTVNTVTEYSEPITVLNGQTVPWKHRRTIWGPIVTDLVCVHGGGCSPTSLPYEYVVRSLILDDAVVRHKHSIRGAMLLMRASTSTAVANGVREWRSPSAHLLVATTAGDIGYRSVTGLPLRPPNQIYLGADILDGNTMASDWPGEVLPSQLPGFLGDPFGQYGKSFLSTANNVACDPALLPQPFVLGLGGDTGRAWRLREMLTDRLSQPSNVSLSDVMDMDHDSVVSPVRTFVVLARVMQNAGVTFSPNGQQLLSDISAWGAPWHYDNNISPTIYNRLTGILRALGTFVYDANSGWAILVEHFGSRNFGVLRILRTLAGHEQDYTTYFVYPGGDYPAALRAWVSSELDEAHDQIVNPYPPFDLPTDHTAGQQDNYKALHVQGGGISNYPPQNYTVHDLTCADTATIWSQGGETYKFIADFDPATWPDGNYALLAPGVCEDWNDGNLYLNHAAGWKSGTMYRAKITRTTFGETPVKTLTYP